MTSKELKQQCEWARDAYSRALDREIASKKATSMAWENYERCYVTYERSLEEGN